MNLEAPIQREQSSFEFLAREFVHGGHLLALGTASIAGFAAILMGRAPALSLLVMAYVFSLGAYMINRGAEIEEDGFSHPERTRHLYARRRYLPFVAVSCFALGYALAAFANIPFFLALLAPLILALAYSVGSKKFLRLIGVKRLKEKLLAKNVVVSFGWSLIPLLVGLYYQSLGTVVLLLAPFVFLRLFVGTIFFDARDTEGDRKNGIRTIPTVYGFIRSFKLMDALDIASGIYIFALMILNFLPQYAAIMLLFPVYSWLLRFFAQKHPSWMGMLCDVACDGEYLLWGPVIVLGTILA